MNNCYVVLHHCPNVDAPEHLVTTLAGVTSTLFLAEKLIGRCFNDRILVCVFDPECPDYRRAYYMNKSDEKFTTRNVEHYTVEEKGINDDWASI